MDQEPIFSTGDLRVAVFSYNTKWDRTGLFACEEVYPKIQIMDEIDVAKILRQQGLRAEDLLTYGDDFNFFKDIPGFHLLILAFEKENRKYLRMVNYLGRYVSTVALDSDRPRCEDFLRSQRLVVIESIPPLADIRLGGRSIGETPLWTWLRDGNYEFECSLPNQIFPKLRVEIPKTTRGICYRQNTSDGEGPSSLHDSPEEGTAWEGVLIYLLVGAVAIGGSLIPLLLFF